MVERYVFKVAMFIEIHPLHEGLIYSFQINKLLAIKSSFCSLILYLEMTNHCNTENKIFYLKFSKDIFLGRRHKFVHNIRVMSNCRPVCVNSDSSKYLRIQYLGLLSSDLRRCFCFVHQLMTILDKRINPSTVLRSPRTCIPNMTSTSSLS